jgi:hypothetical protein
MSIKSTLALLSLLLAYGGAQAEDLKLRCSGVGTRNNLDTSFDFKSGEPRNSMRRERLPADIQVVLQDGRGDIRFPKFILPAVTSGDDGWFRIKKLSVNERKITGEVSINPLNEPELMIDRSSGDIEIGGDMGMSFSGSCNREYTGSGNRKF